MVSGGCHGCQCRDTGIRDGFLVVVTLEHLRLPGTHTGHTSHFRKAVESSEACSALRHRIPETQSGARRVHILALSLETFAAPRLEQQQQATFWSGQGIWRENWFASA